MYISKTMYNETGYNGDNAVELQNTQNTISFLYYKHKYNKLNHIYISINTFKIILG